jgi:hypothetical protein
MAGVAIEKLVSGLKLSDFAGSTAPDLLRRDIIQTGQRAPTVQIIRDTGGGSGSEL